MATFLIGGGWNEAARSLVYAPFLDAAGSHPSVACIVFDEGDGAAQFERFAGALSATAPCTPLPVFVTSRARFDVAALGAADALLVCGGHTPSYAAALAPAAGALAGWLRDGNRPYAGFSAGAAIAARDALVGGWRINGTPVCPEDASEDLDEVSIVPGLALVPMTIDVHAAQWGTLNRVIASVGSGRSTTAVAIDEDTVLIVDGATGESAGSATCTSCRDHPAARSFAASAPAPRSTSSLRPDPHARVATSVKMTPVEAQTRSVVALLGSVACSSIAVALLTTVLGKQVFDLTGSSLALGLLGLAEFAPAALLVFVSGTLADRVDRRKLASAGLFAEAVAIACIAWYSGTNPTSTLPIFGLVIAFGTARAFSTPATRALPADTVMPERLPWLVARQSVTWQGASIVGPVVGGLLYVVNVRLPYITGSALLLVAGIAVMAVKPRQRMVAPTRPQRGIREAVEGVRFVRSQPILLGAISLDLFAVLFGGAVALLPAIAETRLGVGAVGLGFLRAAVGIGAGTVTLFLTVRPVTRRVGRTLLVAVAIFGVGTIALGATTSFAVAFIALAALSGADSVSVFIRSTLVPIVTPHSKRGRVLAVEAVFIGASNELGAFESGVAGQFLGPAVAIVLGGAATLAVAALWWNLFPALRDVDRFPVSVEP